MSLRHALLGLLDEEPASGYDLIKVFNDSMDNVWPATQSQMYTELNRMARDGLICVVDTGARGRKDYEITPDGRAELRRWLCAPATPKPHRSDLLLRVFFLDLVPPEHARAIFENYRETILAQRTHLEGIRERIQHDDHALSINGRIALEFGLRRAANDLGWADWALQYLDEHSPAPSGVSAKQTSR